MAGCGEVPGAPAAEEAVYAAALQAAFDTMAYPLEDLVFPDRFNKLAAPTDFEAARSGVIQRLADRFPRSTVCTYGSCEPASGQTLVMVSPIEFTADARADVGVLLYRHFQGEAYGDGFRLRLRAVGESWRTIAVDLTLVD